MENHLGPVGRYVDPFFQHSQRHYVGVSLAIWCKLVSSILNTLGSFSLPKELGAQRFMIDARASNL